jgi:hypothetical protein
MHSTWARAALVSICCFASGAACRYGYDPVAATFEDDASFGDAPDSGRLDTSLPDAGCDPTGLLADSFSGVAPDPRWDVFGNRGASAAIVNGRVRVDLSKTGQASDYAGFVSAGRYDLSEKRLSIEVPTMVSTSGHAQALVQLLDPEGTITYTAGFEQQSGSLHAFVHGPGAPSDRFLAYDALAQRYWQVRESAGTLFFETSPDGTAWTTVLASSAKFDARRARIELSAGLFQPELLPGVAEFDNLGGTVELGAACKPR